MCHLFKIPAIGTVLFETRFGSFAKSPSVEAAKFIAAVEQFFHQVLNVFVIPVWIDKFYRLKAVQEFYDCMDVMYNFGDVYRKEVERNSRQGGKWRL